MPAKKQNFLLWGASGHAKVLDELIRSVHGKVVALIDNQLIGESPLPGITVLRGRQGYDAWLRDYDRRVPMAGIAAIGGETRGKDRVEYLKLFRSSGLQTPSLIHPTAHVFDTAKVADNCQILAFAVLGADSSIGEACILNTKASIDHECRLGKGVHVAPGATLCGCVRVGDYSFIGVGAIVLPRIKIGTQTIIGAGSVVTCDIPDHVVAYGNPARVIRKNAHA